MPPSKLVPNLVYGWTSSSVAGFDSRGRVVGVGHGRLFCNANFHLDTGLIQRIEVDGTDMRFPFLLDTRPHQKEL